jgi:hypothetical protein
MRELHEGPLRGHFATKMTQRKILDGRYWWPKLYIRMCMIVANLVMHVKE